MLQNDKKIGKLFKDAPKFIYRKGKTIGDYLVRAAVKKKPTPNVVRTTKQGTFACLSCQNCTAIVKGPTVKHPMKGFDIKIKGYHTCNSHNVIYCLKCPWANHQTNQNLT